MARQKVHAHHLAWYCSNTSGRAAAVYVWMFRPKSAADIVCEAFLELSYTSIDLAPFARDMDHVYPSGELSSLVIDRFTEYFAQRQFGLDKSIITDSFRFVLDNCISCARTWGD